MVNATDLVGGRAVDSVKLEIETIQPPINHPPVFDPTPQQTARVGQTLSFDVVANDDDEDFMVLTAAGLPAAAVFNVLESFRGYTRGRFTWTPANEPPGTFHTCQPASVIPTAYSGVAAAGPSQTRLRLDEGSDGTWDPQATSSTSALAAGATVTHVWFDEWVAKVGKHVVEACADAAGSVVEGVPGGEDNNCRLLSFVVKSEK